MTTDDMVVQPGGTGTGGVVDSKGLKGGSLGLLSSVVVGMASTAPAYSLAAVLGLVVATCAAQDPSLGVKAPAIVLIAFIPIYLIAVAYQELNKAEPDCGTTFTWASRAFGPLVGWMGGWGIIAADVIVMANLAQIAGAYSFTFVGDLGWHSAADLASSTLWSTVAGVIWIVVMTWICYRGIEVSARLQYFLLGFEVIVLIVISIYALIKVYTNHALAESVTPSLSWFWPGGLDFGTVICPGILIAIFIYWGWDTAVACNEESEDPGTTPGKAAVLSTFLLLATYAIVTVAAVAFAGTGTTDAGLSNPANSGDVFAAIGPALFGDSFIGHIGLLALSATILTSASASTQTTILPTARTTLSMGVYKALPTSFAKIHRTYLTPTVSTIVMGAVSIFFYVMFTLISSSLLLALIGSVGSHDRLLLRHDRVRLRLVLPQDVHEVTARHPDALPGPPAGCHHADGGLRLRAHPVREGRLPGRQGRQQRHDLRLRRRGRRRCRRARPRRHPDGRLVGDGSRLLQGPDAAASMRTCCWNRPRRRSPASGCPTPVTCRRSSPPTSRTFPRVGRPSTPPPVRNSPRTADPHDGERQSHARWPSTATTAVPAAAR